MTRSLSTVCDRRLASRQPRGNRPGRAGHRRRGAGLAILAVLFWVCPQAQADDCRDLDALGPALGAALAIPTGLLAAGITAGILAGDSDDRDYDFGTGFGWGSLATAGGSLGGWALAAGVGCPYPTSLFIPSLVSVPAAVLGAWLPWENADRLNLSLYLREEDWLATLHWRF